MADALNEIDPLTRLPNRKGMEALVRREIRRRNLYLGPLALGLVDLDNFKKINSRYLIPGGDKVLAELPQVIAPLLRPGDCLGRSGGDRFFVVAPGTNFQDAQVLGQRTCSTIEAHTIIYKGEKIPVSVSIGFAVAREGWVIGYDEMKASAAGALAQAKEGGRNRCWVCPCPNHGGKPLAKAEDF